MKENLKKLLEQSTDSDLRALVHSLYGTDKQIDNRIETALLASDTTELAKHLKKQVQSIKRGSRFIPYRESFEFSLTLDQLIEQIEKLLPDDPKAAFELADLFMSTHPKVYDRCDDSGGSVGESYRQALQLWLTAAAAWQAGSQPCKLDWVVEIRKRFDNNDYAAWDYLISGSFDVLGEQSLRELGKQFEAEVKRLSKRGGDGYNSSLSHAELGLRGVAEALNDVALYELSYLIDTPEPNNLQKEGIAKFCLKQKDAESALKWLQGEWQPSFSNQQKKLLDAAYIMLGRSDDLLQLRSDEYSANPSFERLQELLEVTPKAERDVLQAKAVERASASENILLAVDTLMKLDNTDAAAVYVLKYPERVQEVRYYDLADWAVSFESNRSTLAAVSVYRVLMLEILQAARSKAYGHAARYHKALERLDADLSDYQPLSSKAEFDQELQSAHGKKRSFWSKTN